MRSFFWSLPETCLFQLRLIKSIFRKIKTKNNEESINLNVPVSYFGGYTDR